MVTVHERVAKDTRSEYSHYIYIVYTTCVCIITCLDFVELERGYKQQGCDSCYVQDSD